LTGITLTSNRYPEE